MKLPPFDAPQDQEIQYLAAFVSGCFTVMEIEWLVHHIDLQVEVD